MNYPNKFPCSYFEQKTSLKAADPVARRPGELENRETVRRQTCVLIEELLIAHRRAAAIKESREVGHRRLLAAPVNPNR